MSGKITVEFEVNGHEESKTKSSFMGYQETNDLPRKVTIGELEEMGKTLMDDLQSKHENITFDFLKISIKGMKTENGFRYTR